MPDEDDLDRAVAAYDRELVPWLFEHWAEPMVDLTAPQPSSRIVDVACGSGLIVRHLLGRLGASGRVHGVDFDAAMLAYAANRVDRVSCHQGLQFFPERLAALSEARRVLESGGQLTAAVRGQLAALPSGSMIDQLADEQRSELVELMCELLADHTDAAGRLNVTSTCNLAHGVNP